MVGWLGGGVVTDKASSCCKHLLLQQLRLSLRLSDRSKSFQSFNDKASCSVLSSRSREESGCNDSKQATGFAAPGDVTLSTPPSP